MDITVSPPTIAAEDVLGRARRGEADAFGLLVDTHHAELVRIAYVVCGDVEVARDAVQAAWVKAWERLPGLRDPERLRPWLIAIAANEARMAVRARRRRALREVAVAPDEWGEGSVVTSPGSVAAPGIDRLDLAGALARLDPEDRELIAMRYLAGLSSDEIARVTSRSASGVRARISRLLVRLRQELSDA